MPSCFCVEFAELWTQSGGAISDSFTSYEQWVISGVYLGCQSIGGWGVSLYSQHSIYILNQSVKDMLHIG